MTGMLLCLNREQRLVFILGDIFEVASKTASEFLEMSADNFRQILSRSRKNLYSFMNNKCGLLNTKNPCRCSKRTNELIQNNKMTTQKINFNKGFNFRVRDNVAERINKSESLIEEKYAFLFKDHPFFNFDKSNGMILLFFKDDEIKTNFNL